MNITGITNTNIIAKVETPANIVRTIIGIQGPSGGVGIQPIAITYDELKNLRDNGQLTFGQEYKIVDFQMEYYLDGVNFMNEWNAETSYDIHMSVKVSDTEHGWVVYKSLQIENVGNYPPDDINGTWWEKVFTYKYKTNIEPIIVKAISNNQIDILARSEDYPYDVIYYDMDRVGYSRYGEGISTKGWIVRRVNKIQNIDMSIDWRNLKFVIFAPDIFYHYYRAMFPVDEQYMHYVALERPILNLETARDIVVKGEWWNNVIRGSGFNIEVDDGKHNYLLGYEGFSFINISCMRMFWNYTKNEMFGFNFNGETLERNDLTSIWDVTCNVMQLRNSKLNGYALRINGNNIVNCDLSNAYEAELFVDNVYNQDLNYVRGIFEVNKKKYYKYIQSDYICENQDKILIVDATSGDIVITLMDIWRVSGNEVIIRRVDNSTNNVTIIPRGGNSIEGQESYNLAPNEKVRLLACNQQWQWYII